MTKRIFRAVFTTAFAALVAVLILSTAVLYRYFTGQQREELQDIAGYLAAGTETNGTAYLEQAAAGATRISWIAADGVVLFDNQADISRMENHGDRQEVREALQYGSGESTRISATLAKETCYYAVRLSDGTVLRVARTDFSLLSVLMGLLSPVALVMFFVMVGSGVLAMRLAKSVVRPINQIDLEHPEQTEIYEELRPLLQRLSHQKHQIGEQMEELKQRQQEFAGITDNMSEGLLVLSPKGEILSDNHSAREILGVEYIRKHQSVFEWNSSAELRSVVEDAQKGQHCEAMMELDGHVYQLIANPVTRENTVVGILLLLMDVTERERWDALRREFTANVSHELKTPLTSISGYAEMMKEGLVPPEDTREMAARIYHEARRLIALVADVIELSRLDAGSADQEMEVLNLGALAAQVTEQVQPAAEKRQVKLQLKTEAAMVCGISRVLEEMIYNLCDNAIKYNREQGTVFVEVSCREQKVLLTVEDTGIGIPAEDQERVFERFYRVDKSHSRELGGTGLGLSIVKHGAMIHGAKLKLESKVGVGTRIQVEFSKAG